MLGELLLEKKCCVNTSAFHTLSEENLFEPEWAWLPKHCSWIGLAPGLQDSSKDRACSGGETRLGAVFLWDAICQWQWVLSAYPSVPECNVKIPLVSYFPVSALCFRLVLGRVFCVRLWSVMLEGNSGDSQAMFKVEKWTTWAASCVRAVAQGEITPCSL